MDRTPEAYTRGILAAVLEPWVDGLGQLNAAIQTDKELRMQLFAPGVEVSEKLAAVDEASPGGVPPDVRNFIGVLLQNDDIGLLDEVLDALTRVDTTQAVGPQRATVTTAIELNASEQERIRTRLVKEFGPLDIMFHVNPDILGGIVVRIGDKLIDDSVRGRLDSLRNALGVRAA
jgi:F-type H+-transporting ATPase subunit delta